MPKVKDLLDETITKLKKKFGNGVIMKLEAEDYPKVECISTGIPSLDKALGIGGVPRGRITEIWGKESTGKSTLALKIMAQAQKKGGKVAMIDVEHTIDPEYASKLEVKFGEVYFSQPNSGEEALQVCEALISSGKIDLIILDTVAALTPMAELKEEDLAVMQVALQARLLSKALRKLTMLIQNSNTAVVFLNQVRTDIMKTWGDKDRAPGGYALKFYASVRVHLKKIKLLQKSNEPVGIQIEASIVKNKLAPPFRKAIFEIWFQPETQPSIDQG